MIKTCVVSADRGSRFTCRNTSSRLWISEAQTVGHGPLVGPEGTAGRTESSCAIKISAQKSLKSLTFTLSKPLDKKKIQFCTPVNSDRIWLMTSDFSMKVFFWMPEELFDSGFTFKLKNSFKIYTERMKHPRDVNKFLAAVPKWSF